MDQAIRAGTLQVTVVCLVAAGVLLGLGLAGVSAALVVAAPLLALSAGLYLVDPPSVGVVAGVDVDSVLSVLWAAPGVAALPILLEPTATTAELQALGGLLGLVGMANYFLRPLYLLVYAVAHKFAQLAGGLNGR